MASILLRFDTRRRAPSHLLTAAAVTFLRLAGRRQGLPHALGQLSKKKRESLVMKADIKGDIGAEWRRR